MTHRLLACCLLVVGAACAPVVPSQVLNVANPGLTSGCQGACGVSPDNGNRTVSWTACTGCTGTYLFAWVNGPTDHVPVALEQLGTNYRSNSDDIYVMVIANLSPATTSYNFTNGQSYPNSCSLLTVDSIQEACSALGSSTTFSWSASDDFTVAIAHMYPKGLGDPNAAVVTDTHL